MDHPVVFISYRRDDAAAHAGRLFDWLARQFGRERIFLDTDQIAAGDDFPHVLEERLAASTVLLAVIGPQWLTAADADGPRLARPGDYVRLEVATALARGLRVVPVLVGGARMPAEGDLPPDLRPLARRNAATIGHASFERDFDALVDDLLGRPRGFARREADRLRRLVLVAGRTALVTPVLVVLLGLAAWMKMLDVFALDTQAASYLMWAADWIAPPPTESSVVLAAIDADTERRLGRSYGPAEFVEAWRRDHVRLIERAAAAGARAVVFDLYLERHTPADRALTEAVRRAAAEPRGMRTVFGVRIVEDGQPRLAPELQGAVQWGSLCIVRRLGYTFLAPLAVLQRDDEGDGAHRGGGAVVPAAIPALAVAATQAEGLRSVDLPRRELGFADRSPGARPVRYTALERIRFGQGGCGTLALDDEVAMLMIPLGDPGVWRDPRRRLSYADFVEPEGVPDGRLRDRIVLVGVTALSDPRAQPDVHELVRGFSRTQVHGVELHAAAIAALEEGRGVRMPTADLQAVVMTLMAVAGGATSLVTAPLSRARRRVILAAVVLAYLLIAVAVAAAGLLFNVLYDLAAFLAAHGLLRRMQARATRGETGEPAR